MKTLFNISVYFQKSIANSALIDADGNIPSEATGATKRAAHGSIGGIRDPQNPHWWSLLLVYGLKLFRIQNDRGFMAGLSHAVVPCSFFSIIHWQLFRMQKKIIELRVDGPKKIEANKNVTWSTWQPNCSPNFVPQKTAATFVLAPIRLDNAHGLHRLDGQVTDQSAKPFPLQGWSDQKVVPFHTNIRHFANSLDKGANKMMAGKNPNKNTTNSMFNDLILSISFLQIFFFDSASSHQGLSFKDCELFLSLSFEFGTTFFGGPRCKRKSIFFLGIFAIRVYLKKRVPPKINPFFAQKAKHLKTN